MPIPEHLVKIRQQVGNTLLFIPGVCGLVFNEAGDLLLNRRADTGKWALLGGIIEPGEEPAAAVVREVLEETGVEAEPQRISGVYTTPIITYSNGDQAQYVTITFVCRAKAGVAHVADEESLEVRYFALDELPELRPMHQQRLQHALANGPTWFAKPGKR